MAMTASSTPQTLRIVAPDGVELAADVWNPAAVPTLALMPAGGELREVWRPVVDAFTSRVRERFRIVAIDHRGHGDSGRSARYDFQQFLDDALCWIGALKQNADGAPLVMGGGSIGGALALVVAGEGAAIDGVVLLDVPTVPVRDIARAEVSRMASARAAGRVAMQHVDAAFLTSGFVDDVFRDSDRWRRAAVRLQVPTLLIAGKRSMGTEPPRLYGEHIPHGEFVALDAGHLVARDAPLETAHALERFLLEHFAAPGDTAL